MTQNLKHKALRVSLAMIFVLIMLVCTAGLVRADSAYEGVRAEDLWENIKFSSVEKADIPAWYYDLPANVESNLLAGSGVKVVNYGANATVAYKNTIDVSSLTKDDTFIQIAITPEMRGNPDFKELTIRLIDAEDPTNYVEINIHHSQWWKATTFYQVGTGEIESAGLKWGYYKEGESEPNGGLGGTEILMGAFTGYQSCNSNGSYNLDAGATRPITISYDYEEKAFYLYNGTTTINRYMILDLDDPHQVGYGNEWNGFSTGRVNVQIEVSSFTASEASYIITQFNGVNYGDEYVTDNVRPSMITQADKEELLCAVIGKEYPLFWATADDCIDGVITDIKKYVVLPGTEEKVLITTDSFVPKVAGNYTLIYSAKDAAGNESVKRYNLTAVISADPLKFNVSGTVPESVKVGETVAIPEVSVSGGVGNKEINVSVYRFNGNDKMSENVTSYLPILAGTYIIEYSAKDYLGTEAKITYFFEATRPTTPICEFPFVTDVMASGKTVKLPSVVSKDFSYGGSIGAAAVVNIYASYENGVKGEKIDYIFTPQLSDSETEKTLYLTYETYCIGHEQDAVSKTYEIKVVKAEQIFDLFDRDNIDVVHNNNYLDFTTEIDGADMRYIVPLASKNFEVLFGIPTDQNNFTTLRLTFTDSVNLSQKLVVDIVRNDGSKRCYVYINGEMFEMNGAFNGESNSPFHIVFETSSAKLLDHEGRVITVLKHYSDGSDYTGFDSGRFYVDFEFKGVYGKSTVRLEKLGNQAMFAEYDNDGNLVEAGDYIEPIIVISDYLAMKVEKYSRITIPSAQAFDAMDPYVECYVTVMLNGKKILNRVSAEDDLDILINDYGSYIVLYQAEDSSGNEVSQRFRFTVRDKDAPTLTLLGTAEEKIAVGEKITVPQAIALDRNGDATVRIYIITPTGKMIYLDGNTEYKAESKGTYTIRYSAYDETCNYTVLDFTVEAYQEENQ